MGHPTAPQIDVNAVPTDPTTHAPSVGDRRGDHPRATVGRGTILVADDEPEVRQAQSRMLDLAGFRVLEATDGHEAVTLFHDHAHEVVLTVTDLSMPRLTGEQVFRRIRRLRPTALVILATSGAGRPMGLLLSEAGLAAYLPKPFGVGVYLHTVWTVLTRAEANGLAWRDTLGCWRPSRFDVYAWETPRA